MKKLIELLVVVIIIVSSIMILISCDSQKIKYYIDEETLSYCYFENGISYIFMDSITEIRDTLVISSNWYIPEKTRQGTEYREAEITSKNGQSKGSLGISAITKESGDGALADFYIEESQLNFKYSILYHSFDTSVEVEHLTLIDSYSYYQNGNYNYYDVKKFKRSTSNVSEYTYAYWAKNVGLIRLENYLNDTVINNINLVSYEISD
jgi:hypothetical protein